MSQSASAPPRDRSPIDLAAVRARLRGAGGRAYWRGLEELADSPDFRAWLERELPRQASGWLPEVDRRDFIRLMGASLALAGLSGCTRQPTEYIVPYVRAPEEIVPGEPLFFATAMPLGAGAIGLLAESHMGRPTKIEGNPDHPASLGATDVFAQASVLGLYDPDRSQVILNINEIRPWSAFAETLNRTLEAQREKQGAGLRLLTETVRSPTAAQQLRDLLAAFPAAKWHQYEPVNRDGARTAARLAFGKNVDTVYRLDRADVILALDADFLGCAPGNLRDVKEFCAKRALATMNRLYVVESTPSNTGAKADHRLPLRPSDIERLAWAVAAGLGLSVVAPAGVERHAAWISALVGDLQQHRGRSLVIAGDELPAPVHVLAHAMNQALGNVGHTVGYIDPVEANPVEQTASLRELVEAMDAGAVDVLVILGGNPVYTAPVNFQFAARLNRVPLRIHLGLYRDETAELCHWHVPETHYLESWSDTRAFDGTATIIQPLIAPLYEGRSVHELLAALAGRSGVSSYDLVREHWQKWFAVQSQGPGDPAAFERFWRRAVHDGVVADTAAAEAKVQFRAAALGEVTPPSGGSPPPLELIFHPDPTVYDGRFANNGWLQELSKPLTKLTWDNVALMSARTAEERRLANEDVVELVYDGRTVRAPVWISPGHADGCVSVHLGYGRSRAGRVGTGTGFNAYLLRTAEACWRGAGLELHRTGARYPLACTQLHFLMEGRHIVRAGTLAEYRANPRFAPELGELPAADESMFSPHPYPGYAWGMTIDLNVCTGCNACTIACQAENNIAVVGKAQVAVGREMQWIRVDRYYQGDLDNPAVYHQPVPCMHCELAPCEAVCPVNATVHSSEGLNDMVYNRCVGTRYCSNNCPYKVRRFNFLLYSDWTTESLKLQRNPEVTVRSRGVMEKCTYCVQRITHARIQSEKEGRPIRDGDILTACQQVCPAEAIVFGNINDPDSRVAQLKRTPRNYTLLAELNTRPRTTYLAALKNPNPEVGGREG